MKSVVPISFLALCLLLTSEIDAFIAGCRVQSIVKTRTRHGFLFQTSPPPYQVRSTRIASTALFDSFGGKYVGLALTPIKKLTAVAVSLVSWVFEEIVYGLSKKQKLLFVGAFLTGLLFGRVRPFWQRFLSTLEIPAPYFDASGSATALKGRVASVSDGDTIRLLHVPTMFHPKAINKKKQKLSETTLPVRVCTIDTPETAKFGKKGQPFGVEAKEHLASMLEDKTIFVKLLQKDQYGRIVGQVYTKNWGRKKYVDEEMLKAGFAEVYQGGGAVYGPKGKEYYEELEAEAKGKKINIWSQGKRESAAEYKKRNK